MGRKAGRKGKQGGERRGQGKGQGRDGWQGKGQGESGASAAPESESAGGGAAWAVDPRSRTPPHETRRRRPRLRTKAATKENTWMCDAEEDGARAVR